MAFKRRKEAADCLPYLCATRKATPPRTDESGQRIALIDRHPVILAGAFGTTPEFWTNLQAAYDLARVRPEKKIPRLAAAR